MWVGRVPPSLCEGLISSAITMPAGETQGGPELSSKSGPAARQFIPPAPALRLHDEKPARFTQKRRSRMVAPPHAGKRVLVVDDDFATREMMSLLLASDGYRVATACNGADAIDRLRGFERPDLIILDLKMPKMDGCAFCDQRK